MKYRIISRHLNDSAYIRNKVGTRVWAERIPQNVKLSGDHIILSLISGEPEYHLEGESDAGNVIMQINCYSDSVIGAESLAEAVRNRLSGFHGEVSYLADDGTEATTHMEALLQRPVMLVIDQADGSDKYKYAMTADYNIFFTQPVPTFT